MLWKSFVLWKSNFQPKLLYYVITLGAKFEWTSKFKPYFFAYSITAFILLMDLQWLQLLP